MLLQKRKDFSLIKTASPYFGTSEYLHDFGTVKQFRDKFKLTSLNTCRQSGFELDNFVKKGEAGNDEKLEDNLSRTKARIFELAYCNEWEYFVTLTLDKSKYNRHDLPKFIKDLGQMVRDLRKKYGADIKYLLIPERHQDGAWHMHGFLLGVPFAELREFSLTDRIPQKIRNRISNGKRVFTWTSYERKFGFADIEYIENNEAASKYITKYITKQAMHTITDLNAHCFYASKGLKGANLIAKGFINPFSPDYINEYSSVKWSDNLEELLQYIDK